MPSLKSFFSVGFSGHFHLDRLLEDPAVDGVTQDGIGVYLLIKVYAIYLVLHFLYGEHVQRGFPHHHALVL